MDRLAAHVIATAALTVTLATVPVLFADASHAATTPAANAKSTQVQTSTVPNAQNGPTWQTPVTVPEHPRLLFSGGPCADVRQVGQTAHEVFDGKVAFSVKEYYSPACHDYYGYSFAWLQFRDLHIRYDVGMAVYDVTHDSIDGARTYVGGVGGPNYWSAPVPATKNTCFQGEGHYFYYPANSPYGFAEGDTRSPKVCD
jgi:hypothetical protein